MACRLFRKAAQQGRSERRSEAYSVPYVEPLSDARTPLADFVNSLLVAFWLGPSVSSIFMDLSQLSQDQFKELLRGIVDDRLRELLGDPDLGLQLGDDLRARLKESLSSKERLSGEDIADQLGLRW